MGKSVSSVSGDQSSCLIDDLVDRSTSSSGN